ncbi:hypothetical protein BCV70DRAFT_162410 [Testicularia cyperi]|uniref:DUF2423 domain-containing protein n=1 Tax=Testicularia cyperi TaxID=1882483 RepID=A0A317XQ98_9BASI|nr:hypothetical protein BCV70DRAFT_162410 [Testicularia cyperi]
MAKSLRSSAKLKARQLKRSDPKSDYAVNEAARVNALNARLQAGLKKDKLPMNDDTQDNDDQIAAPTTADEDGETKQKISTAGPRNSRREVWRKARRLTPFKNKGGNKLFDAHKSKNGGKLKRRR